MLLEGNSNVCYPAVHRRDRYTVATCNLGKRRTTRAQVRGESTRVFASRILGASATSITAERGQTELALIRSASKTSPSYAVIIPVTRYSVDE